MEVEEKEVVKEEQEEEEEEEEQQTQQVSQFVNIEATEENVVKPQSGRKKLEKITSLPSQKSLISNVSFLLMKFNFFSDSHKTFLRL